MIRSVAVIVEDRNALCFDIVHKWDTVGDMELVHSLFWNITKMHQDAANGIFMAGNEHPFALVDCFIGYSLCIERNLNNVKNVRTFGETFQSRCLLY